MRPAGEIRAAIAKAVQELHTEHRGPTLQELAARACVGVDAASVTIRNMCRAGHLAIVRERSVAYRNRPVAEYAPATAAAA